MELNDKAKAIYEFLKEKINENGYSPSIREICKGVGVTSTATVHSYLKKLEEEGLIQRDELKKRTIRINEEINIPSVKIPIIGRVQAGEPIFAEQNIDDYFVLPESTITGGEHFLLRVKGESMINAGIFEDDYVLVKKDNFAQNGEIVVALIEDSATVKTFYKEKDHIRLQPENDLFEPIIVTDNVNILGVVKGVFRLL